MNNKELESWQLMIILIVLLALWISMPPVLPQENKESSEVKKDDE